MIKVLDQDFRNPSNYTQADHVNLDDYGVFPQSLTTLEPFQQGLPKPVVQLRRKAEPADFFYVGSMGIVSSEFKQQLELANAAMEYIEVDLIERSDKLYGQGEYFFAHLLKEVDCFDYECSSYTLWEKEGEYWENRVRRCTKLVIHEHATDNETIFRIAKTNLSMWLVSDAFAKQIESTNLRGMIFLEINEVML